MGKEQKREKTNAKDVKSINIEQYKAAFGREAGKTEEEQSAESDISTRCSNENITSKITKKSIEKS